MDRLRAQEKRSKESRERMSGEDRRALSAGKSAERKISRLSEQLDALEASGETQKAKAIEEQMDSVRQQFLKQRKSKTP